MIETPTIDWAGLSPLVALLGGALLVLVVGLGRPRWVREGVVPFVAIASFGAAIGLSIWQWGERKDLMEGALRLDELTLVLTMIFCVAGIAATLLAWRHIAPREAAHGEFDRLLLSATAGMFVLVAATNLVTLFLGLELLSIPLYVLCATETRREGSLEAGLKYLIVGSVGSATLLFGLAFIYGATGSTDFSSGIAQAINESVSDDSLLLGGIALAMVGLAFKASVAPFHQWTPDVYQGAPTPVTAFMAVATKAAALGVTIRLFDVALIGASDIWQPVLGFLAAVTIIVGNVGALGQTSLKRMLAYSSVAQAGYLLAGVVVATQLGVQATVFYLAVYLMMNLSAFAVIIIRERETPLGDSIDAVAGLGSSRPLLAWPLTISMLALAGFPATGGFIGKFFLIDASVDGGYIWLGVFIVIGSMISLGYYLRVVAAVWMRPCCSRRRLRRRAAPARAGRALEADRAPVELLFVAVGFAVLTLAAGIVPQPLFDLVRDAGQSDRPVLAGSVSPETQRRVALRQEVRVRVAAEVPPQARHHELEEAARDLLGEQDREERDEREQPGQRVEDPGDPQVRDGQQPLHEGPPPVDVLGVRDRQPHGVARVVVQRERRICVGHEVEVRGHAVAPPERPDDVLERAEGPAAGEEDGEEPEDRHQDRADADEEERDHVRDEQQPLHERQEAVELPRVGLVPGAPGTAATAGPTGRGPRARSTRWRRRAAGRRGAAGLLAARECPRVNRSPSGGGTVPVGGLQQRSELLGDLRRGGTRRPRTSPRLPRRTDRSPRAPRSPHGRPRARG